MSWESQAALSNLGSLVNVVAAPLLLEPTLAVPIMLAALALGAASGGFHAIRNRFWQKLDVWSVMLQIFAVTGLAAAQIGPDVLAWVIPFTAGMIYFEKRYDINLPRHVYASVGITTALMFFTFGWWTLLPLSLFVLGGIGKLIEWERKDVGAHGPIHAWLWHQPIFMSVLSVIWLCS